MKTLADEIVVVKKNCFFFQKLGNN